MFPYNNAPVQKSAISPDVLTKEKYLKKILATFQQFQYTHSPEVLKAYAQQNRQILSGIITAFPNSRLDPTDSQISQIEPPRPTAMEKQLNDKLEREYGDELELSRGNNLRKSQLQSMEQERQMNSTIMSLDEQLEKLSVEYNQNVSKLEKKRFFKEWNVMSKELEGAKGLNSKLRVQLEKKKSQIKQLTN